MSTSDPTQLNVPQKTHLGQAAIVPDTMSVIRQKREFGVIWYLAYLNRKSSHLLTGLSALSFVATALGIVQTHNMLAYLPKGGIGLFLGTILGTAGYIQGKEARAAENLTHDMLSRMERDEKTRWCHKYTRICQAVTAGIFARIVTRMDWVSAVEYRGYNLWLKKWQEHSRS